MFPPLSFLVYPMRILSYVSGTKDLGILYSTLEKFKLIGYTKNDNGGNIDDRKSTFGYTFNFGTGVVSWDSKEHPIVTISSIEAEYVVATSIACQAIWMKRMLRDLS